MEKKIKFYILDNQEESQKTKTLKEPKAKIPVSLLRELVAYSRELTIVNENLLSSLEEIGEEYAEQIKKADKKKKKKKNKNN